MFNKISKILLFLIIIIFKISSFEIKNNLEFMKSPLNRSINDFSLNFLQQLTKSDENQCNIFFSPFSIMLMVNFIVLFF